MSLLLAAATAPDIAGAIDNIRAFVGPIFIGIIGFVALSFLFKRQLSQFFQFFALAVLVGVLFYTPLNGGIVKIFSDWLGGLFG
jgi:hypothetical protein